MKRLYRSETDRVFTGVCGGIAKYLGVNPMIVRIITVVLFPLSVTIIGLLYIVLTFLLPSEGAYRQ